MIYWIIVISTIIIVVLLLLFIYARVSTEEEKKGYYLGKSIKPGRGCPDPFVRTGGFCASACPKDYVSVDYNECVHVLAQQIQDIQQKLDIVNLNQNKTASDIEMIADYESQKVALESELDSMAPIVPRTQGPNPVESQGCAGSFVWESGFCAKPCPAGFNPTEILCKRMPIKSADDIFQRERGPNPENMCLEGYVFNSGSKMCDPQCRVGYTKVQDTCIPS